MTNPTPPLQPDEELQAIAAYFGITETNPRVLPYVTVTLQDVYRLVEAREQAARHNAICWIEKPGEHLACDRAVNHGGLHSWQLGTYLAGRIEE